MTGSCLGGCWYHSAYQQQCHPLCLSLDVHYSSGWRDGGNSGAQMNANVGCDDASSLHLASMLRHRMTFLEE